MKKNELINKTLAGLMIAAMTAGVCPTTAFAVTGETIAADNTYTKTVKIEPDEDGEFKAYDVQVSLTVKDGKFSDITVTPVGNVDRKNQSYMNDARDGWGDSAGYSSLVGKAATEDTVNAWDIVSGATCTSKTVKSALVSAINDAPSATVEVNTANLEAAIAKAKGLTAADYTAESWAKLQTALTAADAALTAKESQDAVDTAAGNLNTAIDALAKKPEEVKVNTEKLEAAIAKADALKDKEADYTADSWKTMQTALTEAKAALEAKESQEKVDAAEAKLTKAIEALEKNAVAKEVYVLMNIPYDKFYAAEGVDYADAVTSATLNKTRSSLAAGSYHVSSDGSDITGIVYPVKLEDASALDKLTQVTDSSKVDITVSMKGKETTTTYEGKDALFESPSYSYYMLSEVPSYYKEATVNEDGSLSFGKAEGAEVQTLSNVTADFRTSSNYGDYQMNLSGLPDDITTVYGVVVGTKEGDSYGLRHVENIWKISKLAWSTGFVTTAHGNQLQYKDYVPMMGQTISKVTYYTNAGIYEIPMSVYVPVKFDGSVEVADAKASSGETKITLNKLPSDYEAEYSVEGLENVKVENGVLTYTAADAKVGKYTLKVTDKSGKYADISADFTLTTEVTPIIYERDQKALVPADGYSADDLAAYVKSIESVSVDGTPYAASGKGAVKIIKEDGSIDATAKPFANAKDGQEFEIVVKATGYAKDYTFTYKYEDAYTYVYAGLSWAEYWAAEGVQAAGDASSSDAYDLRDEYDKGAFDTVTRATANHGLHRGSFQCTDVIEAENGKEYKISYWKSEGKTTKAVLTDGNEITFNRGTITEADGTTTKMTEHHVTGLKYVPVKVAKDDYEAFKAKYDVVENGGTLAGGYSENKLSSYNGLVAEVTSATNGLKTATKNSDGSFSFSAKAAGTESGIKEQALKTAPSATDVGLTVQEGEGKYGEFLRVDMKGDYGDLAANMQAVKWTYYGSDSTYKNALATYGTKFAADNWMHKSTGIQLGLTDSLRCTLPAGTDGTGYWTITVTALGYEDVTYQFQATEENIAKANPVTDTSELEAAIEKAKGLNKELYTAKSWSNVESELEEAETELERKHTQEMVNEAAEHLNNAIASLKSQYVLMNIPYSAFYKAEVNNDVDVDVFTSATLNKTRTASLAGGSYHTNADGSQIDGITFPVKVTDDMDMSKYTQVTDDDSVDITVTNRGQTSTTTYKGKDALFQNADYAYYNLTEVPSYYKEVSVDKDGNLTFGKTVGNVTTLEGLSAELSTETGYGDYQLDIDGLRDKLTELGVTNINGVVINTKEGSSYGLRHLENIWRMEELAWAAGFTEAVHGCPTSSDHYKAMMGQTITSVTYYTDKGMYNIPLADIYVPVKFTHDLEVANAAITAGKTEVTVTGLPDDYAAEYKVDGLDGVSVQNGVLTFSNAKKGKYTLTISDKNGKYADITTDFELYTESMPAAYDADKKAFVKAADATDEEFVDYIKNITVVNVNGKDYRATGRGATVIINEDGSIKTDAAPFAEGDTFEITVSATGYLPQSFTYTTKEAPAPAEVNTEALKATIAKAEGLKEADYTADSWAAMQTSLTSAKAALEAKESQEAVDAASASLQSSIDALKAATPAETEEETKDDKKDETEAVDTAALEKVIATAKGLKKNDYTAATWSTLQTALTNAEKALDVKESQKSVDEAAKTLQAAIDGLKKAADTTATTDDKKNNNNNNNSTNKNNTTNKNTTTSKNSPKTGDPVSVLGLLGAAISSVGIGGLGLRLRKKSKREDEE
ncbi:penicillin-binding Tp47 domain C-containing protein [Coprococcus sp. B2-R-112]|uniref:penicillin-binding Tp47 domain C-containing protein n=1 Tax=Coprococcus sp. B2-R-112 TaxID=2949662 RepID=UPI00202E8135|nr:penicillin-binding Tp47 domain C-containing protein [Coprococcus sp. B2-R-112]MCM0662834.1 FMN-binding protein [Coprococcus sp. B2-R-112]